MYTDDGRLGLTLDAVSLSSELCAHHTLAFGLHQRGSTTTVERHMEGDPAFPSLSRRPRETHLPRVLALEEVPETAALGNVIAELNAPTHDADDEKGPSLCRPPLQCWRWGRRGRRQRWCDTRSWWEHISAAGTRF